MKRAVLAFAAIAAGVAGCNDVPIDEAADAVAVVDSADAAAEADAPVDATDSAADDAMTADSDGAPSDSESDVPVDGDAGCASGSLCMDLRICKAGTCTACASDAECIAIQPFRRCYDGFCKVGNCKPGATPTGCPESFAACCATETAAGSCFARVDETNCCDDTPCAALPKLTKCNVALHACGCPPPTPGELHVSPTGVDSSPLRGNGSAACPFKTVTDAVFAANGATVATTIILEATTTGPTVFGTDCTGGAPCDGTPIGIPPAIVKGLRIKGSTGKAADIVVTGNGTSVFEVYAQGVGFSDLTIRPTRPGASGGGGNGITYNAAAGSTAVPEGSVTNVAIRGQYATSIVAGSGAGIGINGAASPTLGPGLTIDGFYIGVNVLGPARPSIVATAAAPVTISNTGDNCVRAHSTTATVTGFDIRSTDMTKSITIRDCGSRAISLDNVAVGTTPSRLEGVVIRKTPSGGSFDGISVRNAAQLAVTDVDVINVTGRGLIVDAGAAAMRSSLSVKRVSVTASGNIGALFQGYGDVDVDGLTIDTSASVGLQVAGFGKLTGKTVAVTDSANTGVSVIGNATMTLSDLTIRGGITTGLSVLGGAIATLVRTDIRDTPSAAVAVQGLARATMTTLTVRGAGGHGIRILEGGELVLTSADVRDSTLDGLRCEGTANLRLRRSTFLLNKANGVLITGGCTADLGSSTTLGENVFNKTSLKNAFSGLCFNAAGTLPVPSSSTFGCGNLAAPCTSPSAIPATSVATGTACAANRDVTSSTALTIPSPKCCFD